MVCWASKHTIMHVIHEFIVKVQPMRVLYRGGVGRSLRKTCVPVGAAVGALVAVSVGLGVGAKVGAPVSTWVR